MDNCRRKDNLTAAKVEVGLVFNEMLSAEDAAVYLASNDIAEHVAQRVLAQPRGRRTNRPAAPVSSAAAVSTASAVPSAPSAAAVTFASPDTSDMPEKVTPEAG